MSLPKSRRLRMSFPFNLQRSLFTLALAIGALASAQSQTLSFTLVEQLVIGDDEEAQAEYLFSAPNLVRTDSQGNIYVHDSRRADIRVFDASGRYVSTIGSRGEGPGEMRDIIGIHVDGQDRLIVADRISARFTIFTNLGKSFETKAFAEELTIHPNPILSLENSFVLRYVKLFPNPEGGPSITGDKALHEYDTELNRIGSFAQADDIFDLDRPFLKARMGLSDALKVATNGSDTIVLAPEIYSGFVYRYTRSNDAWVMEKLEGGPAPRRAYIPISKREYDSNWNLRRSSIMTSGSGGTHRARILNRSRGIVILSTGDIVNFTMQTPLRKDPEQNAEVFNQDGTLLGHGPLQLDDPELNGNATIMRSIEILWKDADDRIYLRRSNADGFVVLSVAELVINPH